MTASSFTTSRYDSFFIKKVRLVAADGRQLLDVHLHSMSTDRHRSTLAFLPLNGKPVLTEGVG
jgi:hypothetical protein